MIRATSIALGLTLLMGCTGDDELQTLVDAGPRLSITVENKMAWTTYDPSPLYFGCASSCEAEGGYSPYRFIRTSNGNPSDNNDSDYDDGHDDDGRLSLHFQFTGQLPTEGLTLESIRREFMSLSIGLHFPDADIDEGNRSEFVYFSPGTLAELGQLITVRNTDGMQLDFTAYENERLSGTITGTITVLTHHIMSDDPECITGDMVGICYEDEDVYLPFEVAFKMTLLAD
jgi:hypothetical protein